MNKFLIRLIINTLSLGLASYIVPGIHVDGIMTLIIAAFLLGIVNAIIRPVLVILTLPVTILTLGIFLLVINALMLALVAWLLPGFSISGFGAAFLGWLIMCLIGWVTSGLIKD
jgi:putative membrane protein